MSLLNDKPTKFTKPIKIGIFDSGIGGYSLLNQLINDFPYYEFHYIADKIAAPYGSKSTEEVQARSKIIVDLLLDREVDLIIVACNTATSLAIDFLRKNYEIKFVGVEPFINAVHKLQFDLEKDKITVLTTSAMYESDRFKALLNKYDTEQNLTPLKVENLASIIEEIYSDGTSERLMLKLKNELAPLASGNYSHAILGCTHYPLISDYFEKVLNMVTISPCPNVSLRVGSYFDASSCKNLIPYYWNYETGKDNWIKYQKEELLKPINF
jgi:glutamate racemase